MGECSYALNIPFSPLTTGKGGKAIIRTCLYCEKERRLPCDPNHEVFNWKALAKDPDQSKAHCKDVNEQRKESTQ